MMGRIKSPAFAAVSKAICRRDNMGQRVAIYCRVSTDDQDCTRQEGDLRALADRLGHDVVAVFDEKASGAKDDRPERRKLLELARKRRVDAILVTELSRWGRSTKDLIGTLDELHGRGISVLTANGHSFDLGTAGGRLHRTLIAAFAEFERDLIKERVKSGLGRVKATIKRDGHFITKGGKRRANLGRKPGYRPSDKHAGRVIEMHAEGLVYREIGRKLGLSKNTVMQIIKRGNGSPPSENSAPSSLTPGN
jgi:DNA invertase Pin-like site-specific DNA recombinase